MLVGILAVGTVGLLLFSGLGSTPPNLSQPEVKTIHSSKSLKNIVSHPVNATYLLPEHFLRSWNKNSLTTLRLLSGIYGLVYLAIFFLVLKFWEDTTTAVIGTILLATSAWFLNVSRLATPDILMMSIIALIACGLWLKHTLRRNLIVLICAVGAAMSLYVPGLIWFVLGGIIWQHRTVKYELSRSKRSSIAIATILLLLIAAPFILSSAEHLDTLLTGLGLPLKWPGPTQLVKNLYHIPESVFYRSTLDPVRHLANLPFLDVFEDTMFVLGTYVFWKYRNLSRSRILFSVTILSILLITLGGGVSYTILLPIVYITITVGILYMWKAWSDVFPKNPFARTAGLALIMLALVLSCNYQLRRYFTAWNNAPETKAVFDQRASISDTIKM